MYLFTRMSLRFHRKLAFLGMLAMLFGLFSVRTSADVLEGFNGWFHPDLAWSWKVSGNNPQDTKQSANTRFTETTLAIDFQQYHPYAWYQTSMRNVPNVRIVSQPANWYIETRVSVDWSKVDRSDSREFMQADLLIFQDIDNYTYTGCTWYAPLNNGSVFIGGITEINAVPRATATAW